MRNNDLEEEEGENEEEEEDENPNAKKKTKKKYLTTAINAGRCDVKQLYLRTDFEGEVLPENKWRCVLCSIQRPRDLEACLHTTIEGNTPLHKHLLDVHGLKVLDATERKAEKAGKEKKAGGLPRGQSVLTFPPRFGGPRAATSVELAHAVTKFVVMEMLSFNVIESESFQGLKTVLRGNEQRQPDARKVRELVDAEEERIRRCMSSYFRDHVEYFALSGDGKKAAIKGRPLYGVCLHTISKEFDPIVAPLFVGETEGKDALATKRFILRAIGGYGLFAGKIAAFTGDEAEHAAGELLGCTVLKCAPHRLSTVDEACLSSTWSFGQRQLGERNEGCCSVSYASL